ncbi:MAG: hypothetical protein LAP40_28755 [Acidobacteriia bacterium]|nr:hypothetical protein [Terriglobia bacterium]
MRVWQVLGVLTALSVSAQADVLYDNITGVTSENSVAIYNDGSSGGPIYNSFSTGTFAGSLTNVEVMLGFPLPDPPATISIDVTLYGDSLSDNPDLSTATSLGTIAFTGAAGAYTASLTANPLLSANTRYWIGLSTTQTTGSVLTDPGWSFGQATDGFSIAGGPGVSNEFTAIGTNSSSANSSSTIAFQMIVDGTAAVPEPSPFIPFAAILGLLGLVAADRRRGQVQE